MQGSLVLAALFIFGCQASPVLNNFQVIPSCSTNTATFPYPSDNTRYYYCYNGELLLVQCPVGYYYNQSQNTCLQGTNNNGNTNSCPAGLKAMRADPNGNCQNFQLCLNGVMSQQSCPSGYYFHPETLTCGTTIPSSCQGVTGTCSEEGQIQAVSNNCQVYNYCTNGTWTVQNCPTGYYYSADRQTCGPTIPSSCNNN